MFVCWLRAAPGEVAEEAQQDALLDQEAAQAALVCREGVGGFVANGSPQKKTTKCINNHHL